MEPFSWQAIGALLLTIAVGILKVFQQHRADTAAGNTRLDSDIAGDTPLPRPGWLGGQETGNSSPGPCSPPPK